EVGHSMGDLRREPHQAARVQHVAAVTDFVAQFPLKADDDFVRPVVHVSWRSSRVQEPSEDGDEAVRLSKTPSDFRGVRRISRKIRRVTSGADGVARRWEQGDRVRRPTTMIGTRGCVAATTSATVLLVGGCGELSREATPGGSAAPGTVVTG